MVLIIINIIITFFFASGYKPNKTETGSEACYMMRKHIVVG